MEEGDTNILVFKNPVYSSIYTSRILLNCAQTPMFQP